MLHKQDSDLELRYYYNKKSKYFEELKGSATIGKISVYTFLKYLAVAYGSYDSSDCDEFDFFLNSSTDWLRVTRIELFSELIDVDEVTLYGVMNECHDVGKIKINKEYELFSFCDYMLNIPMETSVLPRSDTSKESVASSIPEPIFGSDAIHITPDENFSTQKSSLDTLISKCNEGKERCKPLKKKKFNKRGNLQGSPENCNDKSRYVQDTCNETDNEKLEDIIERKGESLNSVEMFKADGSIRSASEKSCSSNVCCNISQEENIPYKERLLIIHVKDNAKKQTKDFQCSEELLATKIGYFANRNLRNAEITIYCNIQVFSWIMDWVTQSTLVDDSNRYSVCHMQQTNTIPFSPKTIISFLVCVSFLQIKELVDMCLCYCKMNINEILDSVKSFSCLSRNIFNRFGDMFSNIETESLQDEKNKLRPYLYCKLIVSLSLPEPEPWKGHFSSLANMFRCTDCEKLVMHKIACSTRCLLNNIRLDLRGKTSNIHFRDPCWNLTNYIAGLKKELKSWRKVYWRLWAECHFLYCTTCNSYYSIYYYNKCFYHPEKPIFTKRHREKPLTGVYPCCGSRAYLYECIMRQGRGCRKRNHRPILKNNRASIDVMKILERFKYLIFLDSPDDTDPVYKSIPEGKVQINRIKQSAKSVTLILCEDVYNEEKRELPCFIPEQKSKGLIIQGFDKSKCKPGTKLYSSWNLNTNEKLNSVMRTSSSAELFKSMTEKKHKRTLVGLLMQIEDVKLTGNSDKLSTVSLSGSDDSSEELDRVSSCSSEVSCQSIESGKSELKKGYAIKKQKKRKINIINKKSLRHMIRINQDNQRECEQHLFGLINSVISQKNRKQKTHTSNKIRSNIQRKKISRTSNINVASSGSSSSLNSGLNASSSKSSLSSLIRINHARKTAVWNSYKPLAGSYMRIESEWRNIKKHLMNALAAGSNANRYTHLKSCIRCQDHKGNNRQWSATRRKFELPQIPFFKSEENRISIDGRSQELDFQTAAFKPVSLWKEFKTMKHRLNVDWPNIIALEQKWGAFLQLFNENESIPHKEYKSNLKSEINHFERIVR